MSTKLTRALKHLLPRSFLRLATGCTRPRPGRVHMEVEELESRTTPDTTLPQPMAWLLEPRPAVGAEQALVQELLATPAPLLQAAQVAALRAAAQRTGEVSAIDATRNPGGASSVALPIDAADAMYVVVDAAWLAAHGPGPYVLDQAGTTYVLLSDVRTAGTAFVVGAAGVTLDLNGHTVTYGDSSPVPVVNGGFEEGSGTAVPGWDLSGAPSAALAANTRLLFGSQVLRLSNFSTAQRIVSDPITLPLVGHTYAATITPANPDTQVTVQVSVIDAITGAVLGSGTSAGAYRGFSAIAHFTPTTADPVRLQIDITPAGGVAQSVDLDGATLTVSGDYGILASRTWGGEILGFTNLSSQAQAVYKSAANFTVKNGSILQGQGAGYASSPLFFRNLPGVVVDNVQTLATGMDTQSLEATYASVGVTVRGSTFREDIDNISNRMSNFATLKLNDISGPIDVEGNHLLGSPQIGIMLAANDPQYPVRILNNEIRQNAVVTNGYAIIFSAVQNFTIADNTIIPTNGKGINLDGYNPSLLGHGEFYGNYIDVQEGYNREYPSSGIQAVALRLRNTEDRMGPHRDLSIHDNTFLARTGTGLVRDAQAVRISYVNNNGAMNDAGISLVNNLIKAVLTTSDPWYQARALMLDRVDAGIGLRIDGNVLESNDVSLGLTNDSAGGVTGVELFSNTLRKSSDAAARPYTGILAGFYNREIHDVRIFDTRLDNGATANIVFAGTGLKDLSVGWLLDVRAQDPAGDALAGAAVSVLDRDSNEVYAGTTGTDGWVRGIPVATAVYRQTTTDPRQITGDDRGPFTVQASYGTSSVSQEVPIAASLALTLTTAAIPTVVVDSGLFTYDGTAHASSATALGMDGVTPVAGSFSFTYNGSATAPTDVGTYAVVASFTSADPSYTDATATGSLIIDAATPVFSSLSSPTITAGTATTLLSGHLAAGSVFPTGGVVAITLNGVTQSATVDASGNFSASFATGALSAGNYTITYGFAGDGRNFLAAPNGSGTLTVSALSAAPQVTVQPQSQTVVAGSTVTFTAAASGEPAPTVQWQVSTNGGRTWTNIRGATSTTLTFSTTTKQDGNLYRAVFTNPFGQVTTSVATLTVRRK